MDRLKITIFSLLMALLSGCSINRSYKPDMDYFYINPDKDLSAIGRVVIVELDNTSNYPQVENNITKSLFQAMQKKQLFGINVVYQNEPAWHSLQLNLTSPYTLEQLFNIRKALKCDAVIIGTITEYQPYPHMLIGLRLKLIDLRDGQLLWALEQIWDSTDKTAEKRIKSYLKTQATTVSKPLNEQIIMFSSRKFVKFIAYEVAETLQQNR